MVTAEQLNAVAHRHVFVETVFGIEGGSLKDITLAQANVLNFWLKEGGAEKVPIVVNGALKAMSQTDMFDGDPLASGKQKMEQLLEQHKEDTMGIHYPDTTRVIKEAGEMGYDGTGDVLEALGVESFDAYEGTPDEALEQLLAAMEAKPAPEPEPDTAAAEPDPVTEQEPVGASDLSALAEAPASLNFFGVTQKGWNVQFTLRDFDEDALLKRFGAMMATLEKYKVMPCNRYGDPVVSAAARPKAQTQKSAGPPPPTSSAPQVASSGGNGGGDVKSGTDPLNKITVDADGRVEFHVGSFRWPFKDSRGGEVVAGLFDEDLGWTPAHFAPGAKYDGPDVEGLMVDWAKPAKYYDVVRVHK